MNRNCVKCGKQIDVDQPVCISSIDRGRLEHWACDDPDGHKTETERIRHFTNKGAEAARARMSEIFNAVRGTPHQNSAMDLGMKSPDMSASAVIEFCRNLPAVAAPAQADSRAALTELCRPVDQSPWKTINEQRHAQFKTENGVTIIPIE